MKSSRIKPNLITDFPNYKVEKKLSFPDLKGGLNLSAPDTEIKANESPEMQNLCFMEGTLNCRDGQRWLDEDAIGSFHSCFPELWHGALFAHLGTKLVYRTAAHSAETDAVTLGDWVTLRTSISESVGTFVLYKDYLIYKTKGHFLQISASQNAAGQNATGQSVAGSDAANQSTAGSDAANQSAAGSDAAGKWVFTLQDVAGYIPIIQINTTPTTGVGDLYQSENRYSPDKTVWYNADGGKIYTLPVKATSVAKVVVDGVQLSSGYSYDSSSGKVTFTTSPPVTSPPTNNTVQITYTLANTEAYNSIDQCNLAAVYGGSNGLCLVLSGYPGQPNAYLWNGNSSSGMEVGYFPMDQYQLAGNAVEAITGFGLQQAQLIIFKENSVGKTEPSTVTIDDRDYISMPYTPINAKLGCNMPGSIQLIENYLVWAHTRWGILMLNNTTEADENNIEVISRKVNGGLRRGLIYDLERADSENVCSYDDGKRYVIALGDHAYVWDYTISSSSTPCWFYYTGIIAEGFIQDGTLIMHINSAGQLSRFARIFSDYDGPIEKIYRFAGRFFDTYDNLKNIDRVEIAMRSDTNTRTELVYITDHERRKDLTDLTCFSWQIFPRDLTYRCLAGRRFPNIFVRRPMCRHVKHFSMRLYNNQMSQDMSVAKADVYFNLQGRDRGFLL